MLDSKLMVAGEILYRILMSCISFELMLVPHVGGVDVAMTFSQPLP